MDECLIVRYRGARLSLEKWVCLACQCRYGGVRKGVGLDGQCAVLQQREGGGAHNNIHGPNIY